MGSARRRKVDPALAALPIGSLEVPVLEADQGYEILVMDRRECEDWPFNPRYIDEENAQRLKNGLAALGLIGPAGVWNKRNRKLVGGHQRLDRLDSINGSPVYRLRMVVVDFDDDTHAEAAVLLNNFAAMGDWNLERLAPILRRAQERKRLGAMGMGSADVYRFFGGTAEAMMASEDLKALADKLALTEERHTALMKVFAARDTPRFFHILVWKNEDERCAAADLFSFDQELEQSGDLFLQRYRDFLEETALNPARSPIDRGLAAARLLVDFAPNNDTVRDIILGYLEQAIASLRGDGG